MLQYLKVIQQFLSRLMIAHCQKNTIKYWKNVGKLLKIKFDSEPVYGNIDKHIKTKIKIYYGNVNTSECQKKKHYSSLYQ